MHAPNTCQVLDSAHSVPKNFDLLLFCKMHSFGEFLICRHARDFRLIPKGEADKKKLGKSERGEGGMAQRERREG